MSKPILKTLKKIISESWRRVELVATGAKDPDKLPPPGFCFGATEEMISGFFNRIATGT
jgi:hypothetical protein